MTQPKSQPAKPRRTRKPKAEANPPSNQNEPDQTAGASAAIGDDDGPPVEVFGALMDKYAPEAEPGIEGDGEHVQGDDFADGVGEDGYIDQAAFQEMMRGMFMLGGGTAGLATLHNAPTLPTFEPACSEFYKVCKRVPSLNFMVKPENETFQSIVVIGAFVGPVARATMMEVQHKRKLKTVERTKPQQTEPETTAPEPANQNEKQARRKPDGTWDIPPGGVAPPDPEAAENDSYLRPE
jgi:hypothetical protein